MSEQSIYSPKENETIAKEAISSIEETANESKAGVLVWNYQNSNEDIIRCIAIDVEPINGLVKNGTIPKEDVQKIVWAMDKAIESVIRNFDVLPKDPTFQNIVNDETHTMVGSESYQEEVKRLSDS